MEQPMTRQAYERLQKELERLENEERPKVLERLKRAREFGDLSENAEYDASKEQLQRLDEQINMLRLRLSRCRIVDEDEIPRDRVAFGAKVRVFDETFGEEEVYEFVSPGEEDAFANKILITSPLGQALLGKKVGEVVEFEAPAGVRRLKILEITYSF